MNNLQRLIATQAALDISAVLSACRDEPADHRGGFIDLIQEMSDERIAAAFASLAMLVTDNADFLDRYRRPA
jgi:hypothetical protein